MGVLALVRVASLIHRVYLDTGSRQANVHLAWMEGLCFVGAIINVFRVPERWLHTKQPAANARKAQLLDLWGNSHQIMHVLSAAAIWHIFQSVSADAAFMRSHPGCP